MIYALDKQRSVEQLSLLWGETEKVLERAPDGFVLPMEPISQGKIEEGVQNFRERKSSLPPNLESHLNSLGYRYLAQKKIADAVSIFKLNVELFPESANAYDSLAEAYILNSQSDLAIENYQKSLDLNPENQNAIKMLEKMKQA